MTKEEQKQMDDLIKKESHSVTELNTWSNKLKQAEVDKDRDILDRFEAFKYRIDCDNLASAKNQQILAYMNIKKNLAAQEAEKKKQKALTPELKIEK
jgi:hypothetical protein